jgi:hypothetical protein
MKPTNDQIVESIIDLFKTIEKEDQMFVAIGLIVHITNIASSNYCEAVGIVESAKNEFRDLLLDEEHKLKFSNN